MITKIQSFTDVITNSSSTVFVMTEPNANYYDTLEEAGECISIEPITFGWLLNNADEAEMICDLLNKDISEIAEWHESKYSHGGWWGIPNQETWESFLECNREEIEKVFEDLYWVDIEDHFEDACNVTKEACNDAKWFEYRH